jgi:hypothetical protein
MAAFPPFQGICDKLKEVTVSIDTNNAQKLVTS